MTPAQWAAIRPRTDPAMWPAVDILVTRPAGLYDIINVCDANNVENFGGVLALFGWLPAVDAGDGRAEYGHVSDPSRELGTYDEWHDEYYKFYVGMQPNGWTPAAPLFSDTWNVKTGPLAI